MKRNELNAPLPGLHAALWGIIIFCAFSLGRAPGGGGYAFAQHEGHHVEGQQGEASPEEEEPPVIEISDDKQQLIGVKKAEAAVRHLRKTVRTVGRIEYDERRIAAVNTRFEGWIEKLHVDFTGRYVKKGEPLADIYSPELYATQQEFINVLRWVKEEGTSVSSGKSPVGGMLRRDAGALVEAVRQRLKLWDITDEQIEGIARAGRPFRTLTVFSPLSGYVMEKKAVQGVRVMPGETLFTIADLSSLWVLADLYEQELAFVRPGQKARISLSYFPGREFDSRVDYLYPTISGSTRTATARFQMPNSGGDLMPGMFTTITISVDLGSKLSIPDEAVIETGVRRVVYVDRGEGIFEPREVKLGARADGFREVLEGLQEGDMVAASATFLIDSEAQLYGVSPAGGHQH